uniref:protein KRBA1-like isoform X2 n=1 Tax=Podarcis muralis TaxID=64176 RepID=UPI00109F9A43|nr:protein KRBA1-like isoform X2 [Podarcis muralis]
MTVQTMEGGRTGLRAGLPPQATLTDPLDCPAAGEAEPNRGGPGGLAREASADPGHEPLVNSWKEGGADSPVALGASVGASLSSCSSGRDTARPKSLDPRACQEGVSKHLHPSLTQAWLGGPSPNDDTACCSSLSEMAAEEKPLQGLLKCLKELIVHQPPHTSRWNPSSSWQPALRQKMREGACGSPLGQVKIEAVDEELPAPSLENTAAQGGSSPPVAPSCRVSTCQTEGGRRRSRSEAKDRNIFAVVKMEEPSEDLVRDLKEVPEEERDLTPSLPEGSLSQSSPETGMDLGMWVPYSEAWSPVTSPLHGLLNCLKDIPDPRPQASQAVAGKRGGGGKERRKGGKRGRLDPLPECFLPRGPETFLGESPCQTPSPVSGVRQQPPGSRHRMAEIQGGDITRRTRHPLARPGEVSEGGPHWRPQPALFSDHQLLHRQLPRQAPPADPRDREVGEEGGRAQSERHPSAGAGKVSEGASP